MTAGFERAGGLAAIGVAVVGLLYSIAFVVFDEDLTTGLLLLLTGLLTIVALTATYFRVREVEAGFALLALVFGVIGGAGAAIHGGWDLAYEIESEAPSPAVPHYVDPRGLLTFGFVGVAVLLVAWLIGRGSLFPARLGLLGYVLWSAPRRPVPRPAHRGRLGQSRSCDPGASGGVPRGTRLVGLVGARAQTWRYRGATCGAGLRIGDLASDHV